MRTAVVEHIVPKDITHVLDSLPDAASLHSKNGNAIWLSQKAEILFGVESSQSQKYELFSVVNPQDRLFVLKAFSDCHISGETQDITFRCQMTNDLGEPVTHQIELRISPYLLAGENHCLAIMRDVTKQTMELNSSRKQADIAQNSCDTKSMFISNVSHELRTPLNSIIGFSQMLMGEASLVIDENKKVEYAGLINKSANHLLAVINDILDLSKIEAGKFQVILESINAKDEIVGTMNLLKPIADAAGVKVQVEVDDTICDITFDPRAFRQIIINLVANAIKFSSPGQFVEIRLKRTVKKVLLEVSDTGIGMDKETLGKLGSVFYQANQSLSKQYEGAGLGLSIVRGLVELHDGKVSFESAPDAGTTVHVEFPVVSQKANPVPSNPDDEIIFLNKSREPNLLRRLDKTQTARKVG